jgi:hypothetical protein
MSTNTNKLDVMRYDPCVRYIGSGDYVGDMEESFDGDYMLFSDCSELLAQRDRAVELLRKAEAIHHSYAADALDQYDNLASEICDFIQSITNDPT